MNIEIEYDPDKNQRNIEERDIDFDIAKEFKWDTALIWQDTRKDYTEPRYSTIGFIHNRLHVLVFTPRNEAIRIISLRKANKREVKRYDNHQQS